MCFAQIPPRRFSPYLIRPQAVLLWSIPIMEATGTRRPSFVQVNSQRASLRKSWARHGLLVGNTLRKNQMLGGFMSAMTYPCVLSIKIASIQGCSSIWWHGYLDNWPNPVQFEQLIEPISRKAPGALIFVLRMGYTRPGSGIAFTAVKSWYDNETF